MRPIHKDYYYVNYHATIDAIKYRIYRLSNQVSDLYKPSEQKKDYYCPRCQARYDQLEVLHNVDLSTDAFLCNRCGYVLQRDEENANNGPGHERSSQLNAQLGKFLGIMGQIDEQDIPANNFETALAVAIPVRRNEDVNPKQKYNPVEQRAETVPTAVKGNNTSLTSTPLALSLTSSVESFAAEKASQNQRNAELAAQNALPIWHTASTITGETTALGNRERERLQKNENYEVLPIAKSTDEKAEGTALNDELAAYYIQMQQEKERDAREEQDESTDEDDEFEDVEGTNGDVVAFTSSEPAITTGSPSSFQNAYGLGVKDESDSESSGPMSTASAFVSMQAKPSIDSEDEADERQAKRIKVRIMADMPAEARGLLSDEDLDQADEAVAFEDI